MTTATKAPCSLAKFYHKHSDLVSQVGLLTLNTTIFAGKVFNQIPPAIPNSAKVMLNYMGLPYLNIAVRDVRKCFRDLQHAWDDQDRKGMLLTAAKVSYKATNILLTVGGFAASVALLCGSPASALIMYNVMRPFGMASWLINICMEFSDFYQNQKLITDLQNCKVQDAVVAHFQALNGDGKAPDDLRGKKLAIRLTRQLEYFTLESFQEKLDADHLFQKLKRSLETKQTFTKVNLGFIALGYASSGLCRAYPNTLTEALTTWVISILWTGKLIWQKVDQAKLENSLATKT